MKATKLKTLLNRAMDAVFALQRKKRHVDAMMVMSLWWLWADERFSSKKRTVFELARQTSKN